jgi:DNA-binding MarR family transcriptional regulator
VVTPAGKAMTDRIDAARERLTRPVFETWDPHEIDEMVRLVRKLADTMSEQPAPDDGPSV